MERRERIGLVGTGIMGLEIARRLLAAGHGVTVWNRTRTKAERLAPFGARVVDTPDEAGRDCDVAIVLVSDGPASEAVIGDGRRGGLLAAMAGGAGGVLVVMSSIPPATAKLQGERAAGCGISYLDAPVSGGQPGAREGTLAIMVGGERAAFDRAGPVFTSLGRATYMGPAGAGSLAKLANQIIVGNTLATIAEALLLVELGGGDPGALCEALAGGFADSVLLQNHGRRMAAGDFEAGGPSRLQMKDMRSADVLAADLGLELPMTRLALDLYRGLVEHGSGDLDHNATILELRRRNGL